MNDTQADGLAREVLQWLKDNEAGMFNICCQRCNAPFEHSGRPVAAPPEWYGGLKWERELAEAVAALEARVEAAEQEDQAPSPHRPHVQSACAREESAPAARLHSGEALMTEVKIVNAEALVIGPDDRLLIRLPDDSSEDFLEGFLAHLREMGLGERALLVLGEVELTIVKPEEPKPLPEDYAETAQ